MKPSIRTTLIAGFGLAAALLVFNTFAAAANARRLAASNRRVLRTSEALRHLGSTLSTIKDAETGQRGYLLTGQESYLEPYKSALTSIGDDLKGLRTLLEDPEQQRRIGVLESKIGEKFDEAQETVARKRREGADAGSGGILTGRGKRLMDQIRDLVGEMEGRERESLARRTAEVDANLDGVLGTFALATAAVVLVLVLLLIVLLRHLASRQRAEAVLRGQMERWRVTLSSVGDAVIVTDERGRVTFMNPLAESLCGWTQVAACGKPLAEVFRIIGEEGRRPSEDPVAKVLREGVVVGLANHTLLVHADGSERPIHDSAAPIADPRGRISGVVLVFRDDTGRRTYERDLLEASRRKDEFLAMLAHELRNPLASIRSAVETFDMPGAEDHGDWAKEVIGRQVNHLAHLLDDLLDVSRITRGMIQVRKGLIDARPVLDNAIASVRPLIDDRHHRFDVSISPRALRLEADPVRLEQILVNLLTNAAKYTPAGGRIGLAAEHVGDQIVIRVSDTGLGIPPEVLPRIFDLFTQAERTLDRSEGGLGVGLTIVKKLVELHGGTVSARSEGAGRGCEFIVQLPAARQQPPVREDPAAPTTRTGGQRVLIIDDNKDLARGMGRLLKLLGHEVEMAHDGPEGIEAARDYRPEVILLDIGLPNLDGYQVARSLRQGGGFAEVLIIAVSGYGQEEDRQRSREAGMDHHLTKPVDIKTLAELIASSV